MKFKILGDFTDIEIIAKGKSIKELPRLRKIYGKGNWIKRKGIADIQLPDGTLCKAEIHWYEAHGIGKKEFKVKYLIK